LHRAVTALAVLFMVASAPGFAEETSPPAVENPLAAAVAEERLHLALAAGSGVAFGGNLGVHAELLYEHVAASFGVGADLNLGEAPCFAIGGRWFYGNRSGAFVAGSVAWIKVHQPGSPFTAEFDDSADLFVAATVGYRFMHRTGVFFDAGIGAAWLRTRRSGFAPVAHANAADCTNQNQTTQAYACQDTSVLPDVNLALGFDF
jgi:hypothetical protein